MKTHIRGSPLDSSIVSIIGGIIILYVGVYGLYILLTVGSYSVYDLLEVIFGTTWGLLIVVFSVLLFFDRNRHRKYGSAIIILSFASWYGTSGGLFVGFILAFLGGIMGLAWKPARQKTNEPEDSSSRT